MVLLAAGMADQPAVMTVEHNQQRLRVICAVSWWSMTGEHICCALCHCVCVCVCVCGVSTAPKTHPQIYFDSNTKKVGRHYAIIVTVL